MLNIVWYRNRYYGKKKFDEIINNYIELGIKIKVKIIAGGVQTELCLRFYISFRQFYQQ